LENFNQNSLPINVFGKRNETLTPMYLENLIMENFNQHSLTLNVFGKRNERTLTPMYWENLIIPTKKETLNIKLRAI